MLQNCLGFGVILNHLALKGIYCKKIMVNGDESLPPPFFFGFREENEKYYFGDKIPNRSGSFVSKNKQFWLKTTLQRKRTPASFKLGSGDELQGRGYP